MQTNPGYTIIIPVYNEIENLEETMEALLALAGEPELIFVNDSSTDGSGEELDKLAREHESVKVLHHLINKGYGGALKTGLANSENEIIVITDADGTYPNDRIPELVSLLTDGGYDMVVGSRTGKNVNIPLIRKPAKWVINQLANYLSGFKIPDLNSGLRAMKKEIVRSFLNILPDGFSFTTTITLAMLTNNFKVKYLPINYFKRGGASKIHPIKDTLNFFQLIIRTVMYFEPLKIFIPLSSGLFLAALGVLGYSYFMLDKVMDVTTLVLFIGSLQMLATGMLADLIDKRIK